MLDPKLVPIVYIAFEGGTVPTQTVGSKVSEIKCCAEREKKNDAAQTQLVGVRRSRRVGAANLFQTAVAQTEKSAQCRNVTSSAAPFVLQTLCRASSDKESKWALSSKC